MIRVLVWAKSAVMRAGLEALVRADFRFEVVSSQRRTIDLQAATRELSPDVILLDGGDELSMSLLAEVFSDAGSPSSVMLVDEVRRSDILRILRAGVRGLLLRDAQPDEITQALSAAHCGMAVLSPEILGALVPAISGLPADDELPAGEPLTPREIEVLALLADGAGNKEISHRMQISEHTVKFHVSSILNKLGAATRTEAVTRGYKEGLILI